MHTAQATNIECVSFALPHRLWGMLPLLPFLLASSLVDQFPVPFNIQVYMGCFIFFPHDFFLVHPINSFPKVLLSIPTLICSNYTMWNALLCNPAQEYSAKKIFSLLYVYFLGLQGYLLSFCILWPYKFNSFPLPIDFCFCMVWTLTILLLVGFSFNTLQIL